MVLDVEVRILETRPAQVELVIRGTLPDQCQYRFYTVENRVNQSVRVNFQAIHPANSTCSSTEHEIEFVLLLGRDLPEAQRGFPPGEYRLIVNNFQTSFTIR